MKDYNPSQWFWVVGGDQSKVYSSAVSDYVQPTDASLVAWKADGTLPTNIASEAELGEVLAAYSLRPIAANVLDGYQTSQASQLTIQVVAKILLWTVNQILVLQGKSALNAAQFRAFVKTQL